MRVERMRLRLEPESDPVWVRDVFGNSIALVDWSAPADSLIIVNDLVVERLAPFPAREMNEPWRVPLAPQYDPLEGGITAVYQQLSFLESEPSVRAWLDASLTIDADDAEGTMLSLCGLVHASINYQRRTEKGVQAPARTLELRTGSCRDMATLMMEAARLLGVASRFASGYLHGTASLAGHASTHAWTEVYLPLLGWRGFDPTLGTAISLNHIVTGVSSHPRGVMPVSGRYTGGAADCQSLTVTVRTEELGMHSIW